MESDDALFGMPSTTFVQGSGARKSAVDEEVDAAEPSAAGGVESAAGDSSPPTQAETRTAAPAKARAMVACRDGVRRCEGFCMREA